MTRTQQLNQLILSELAHLRNSYNFPGATASYVIANNITGSVAIGYADIEKEQPMTTDSRMLAASIGKTFVAATTIALAKEGRLSLDDPLSSWLGKRIWYSRLANNETITLRHLLTHSSGLQDHTKKTSFVELFSKKGLEISDVDIPQLLVGFILDEPPLFDAGKGWHYTDTGYILLGLVIETATGNTYYDEVRQRFIKPLGLDHTSPSNKITLPSLAAGYTYEDNFFRLPQKTVDNDGALIWNPAIEWTGGGLVSTSYDLARWAKQLYEGKALPYEYLEDLLQSIPVDDKEFGLGVLIENLKPFGMRYGHGGVIPGYVSSMRYYPKYGAAIAFQINTDRGISDHSTELVSEMEQRLAKVITHVKI